MTPYSYQPLAKDGQSIRLLRLILAPHIAARVACEIFHAKIRDPLAEAASYEALFYTWGDTSQTVDIELAGNIVPATVNLDTVLRCLRQRNE